MIMRRGVGCFRLDVLLLTVFIFAGCGGAEEESNPPLFHLDGDSQLPADGDDSEEDFSPADGDETDAPFPDGDKPADGDDVPDGDAVEEGDLAEDGDALSDGDLSSDGDLPVDGDFPEDGDETLDGDDDLPPVNCGFDYDFRYDAAQTGPPLLRANRPTPPIGGTDVIAHAEPAPPGYFSLPGLGRSRADLVIPDYSDTMPLFERAEEWEGATRCYETPGDSEWLGEAQAYDLYARLVAKTLWYEIDATPGQRTVVGLRGAYPGTFEWHGNLPDRFNDTLVLLWREAGGAKRVLEFPVNTDTGAVDFGYHSSSSLYPNRRYAYADGWHRGYNALAVQEWNYIVRDDANGNGHWDSDRNGWLEPFDEEDHYREGSAHNIHMGSVDYPLGAAVVDSWSAGCQVIPGISNWIQFITNAWTQEGDPVDYYLLDTRDIPADAWTPCAGEDGAHACPIAIRSFPFTHRGDTSASHENWYHSYNCAEQNENGPEVVYVLNIRRTGTLHVEVSVEDEVNVDPDIHLLEGDDMDACRARAHTVLDEEVWPGRYLIIVDTWVDGSGNVLKGPYTLNVNFE